MTTDSLFWCLTAPSYNEVRRKLSEEISASRRGEREPKNVPDTAALQEVIARYYQQSSEAVKEVAASNRNMVLLTVFLVLGTWFGNYLTRAALEETRHEFATTHAASLSTSRPEFDDSHGLILFDITNSGSHASESGKAIFHTVTYEEPKHRMLAHQRIEVSLPNIGHEFGGPLPFTIPVPNWSPKQLDLVKEGNEQIVLVGKVTYFDGFAPNSDPICLKTYVHFATKALMWVPCTFRTTFAKLEALENN